MMDKNQRIICSWNRCIIAGIIEGIFFLLVFVIGMYYIGPVTVWSIIFTACVVSVFALQVFISIDAKKNINRIGQLPTSKNDRLKQ